MASKKQDDYDDLPSVETVQTNKQTKSRNFSFMYATIAFLVAAQVVLSVYIESNSSSDSYSSRAADTLLARSSSTTVIPAGKGAAHGNDAADTNMPSWEMWDRESIIPSHTEGHVCRWTNFHGESGQTVPMCVHPQSDVISNRIVQKGSYGHCQHLVKLWNEAESVINEDAAADTNSVRANRDRDMLFVDIGANIGACVLTVLLSTSPSTKIVAFEPSPDNQFCLTSTLLSLPAELRDRVYFYPIALGSGRSNGNTPSISSLYEQHDNMGNSVIHKSMGVKASAVNKKVKEPVLVVIEPLDQIIKMHTNSNNNHNSREYANIPLVKVDGQGFECEILKGMESIFPFVGSLTVDVYGDGDHGGQAHQQRQFGCDANFMFMLLKEAQFRIYVNGKEMTEPPAHGLSARGYEIVATRFAV